MKPIYHFFVTSFIFILILFTSCETTFLQRGQTSNTNINSPENPQQSVIISRKILDQGQLTPAELTQFFYKQNPNIDVIELINLAKNYVNEAKTEGINSDVAFAQMCLETGFLKFGGLVQPEWHNYCGLGAMDAQNPGCIFETQQLGVRAHIQHLQAYATKPDVELKNELIDPRYSWVHKTKYIENIQELSGTWATDPNYGDKIESILQRMEQSVIRIE